MRTATASMGLPLGCSSAPDLELDLLYALEKRGFHLAEVCCD